jgi:hypothetical protein
MTRQRFYTTAEKLYNCNLISQLQKKKVQLLFHFTTAKFYVGIIELNAQLLFHFINAKELHDCKTNAQQQKHCTTAKQIYCNTIAEALTEYSTWGIIILLLFSLTFSGSGMTFTG